VAVITGPAQVYVTSTSTSTSGIWANWNQQWTSIGTTTGSTGWIQWNTDYLQLYQANQAPSTEEQLTAVAADWEQRRAEQQEQNRRYAEEAATARAHAEELLLALLSDEQAETWREHDYFFVHGSRTGRRYRVSRGITHNVHRMMPSGIDEPDMNYCAHPPGVPAEDVCLAQMFLLATDEDAFLRVANSRPVRSRPQAVSEVREVPGVRYDRPLPPDLRAVA
jgi:hypothetical protein